MRSGRDAVTRGSFCRSDPAAALRGFANGGRPAATCASLSVRNASTGRNTSPRISMSSGCVAGSPPRTSGIVVMVRTLSVTSSPVRPSPRVAARTSRPRSYSSAIASPSIFSSVRYASGASDSRSRCTRCDHASRSSRENALSSDSMRCTWSTAVNSVENVPPTRCVGESGVRSPGCSASSASSARSRSSYAASDDDGASRT